MKNLYSYLTSTLNEEIKNNNVFYFNGNQIKAVAFKQGCKCTCISKIKKAIKQWGFEYDYDFDAYVFKDKKDSNYRLEKNLFISSIIEWKIKKTKTSKNGEKSEKLFFQGFQ